MLRTRVFPEANYKAFHLSDSKGTTIRIPLDADKPITEPPYPEFYDVKVTSNCQAACPWCYQSSAPTKFDRNILTKFSKFFGKLDKNQKPFQIAFGGGEPTSHPDFIELIKLCRSMDITPNYTTNGMHITDKLIAATKQYCGGVAVSTHPHLDWRKATNTLLDNDIFTNLHVIISDKKSIDTFISIYNEYHGRVKYFILLPLSAQGRCKSAQVDWKYLSDSIPGSPEDIGFGANFYPYLQDNRFKVSMYEPEMFSKYLDLETMNIYPSSFSNEVLYNAGS